MPAMLKPIVCSSALCSTKSGVATPLVKLTLISCDALFIVVPAKLPYEPFGAASTPEIVNS
ncbi:hypothetical protein D3C78_1950000 [compost metagenome]